MANELKDSGLTEAPDSILIAASKRGEERAFDVVAERNAPRSSL
jgi:hypothetical protein